MPTAALTQCPPTDIMARSNQPVIRSAEQQKKFDAVKQHYRMLMTGEVAVMGAERVKQPRQHHHVGIQGGGTFLPIEKVNTAWYRVDNSVRKSKWKCLGHYDDDGVDEDGDKAYDEGSEENKADKDAKKRRKAYRRGKGKNLLASEVGTWADE